MAKVQKIIKSRKEVKCSKCGKILPPGSSYLKCEPYSGPVIIRCVSCGLRPWEASSSSYIHSIMPIIEDWRDIYTLTEDVNEEITSDLENILDELNDHFDNIPEQLQDGAAGELLQDRISNLEDVIFSMENLDKETLAEDAREYLEMEYSDDEESEFNPDTCDDPDDDYYDEWYSDYIDRICDEIDSILSDIEV